MYQPWIDSKDWEERDIHLKSHRKAAYQRPSLPLDLTPGIHTLLGPRRIGKSTQLKLWIQETLKTADPKQVAYLDLEQFEHWKEFLSILRSVPVKYLFLDEVTAITEWTRALKVLADEGFLENTCVWLTGSNAFDLKNAGERLPGRRGKNLKLRDVELLPLTFQEFKKVIEKARPSLSSHDIFERFCLWGGYPMAVSESLTQELPSYDLLQELLDVILGEISRQHRSPRLSAALAERLWYQLGGKSSYQSLSKFVDAGSHPIIRQYIEILEGSYLILEVEKLNLKTKMGILRKEKKFYFFDPLVMGAIVSWSQTGSVQADWLKKEWASSVKQGHWIENMLASEFKKRGIEIFYDEQFGGEIDFIFKEQNNTSEYWSAVEVKRSMPHLSELKPLQAYPHSAEVWVLNFQKETSTSLLTEKRSPKILSLIDRLMSWNGPGQ